MLHLHILGKQNHRRCVPVRFFLTEGYCFYFTPLLLVIFELYYKVHDISACIGSIKGDQASLNNVQNIFLFLYLLLELLFSAQHNSKLNGKCTWLRIVYRLVIVSFISCITYFPCYIIDVPHTATNASSRFLWTELPMLFVQNVTLECLSECFNQLLFTARKISVCKTRKISSCIMTTPLLLAFSIYIMIVQGDFSLLNHLI